jgi:hypothetical protein
MYEQNKGRKKEREIENCVDYTHIVRVQTLKKYHLSISLLFFSNLFRVIRLFCSYLAPDFLSMLMNIFLTSIVKSSLACLFKINERFFLVSAVII